MAQMVNALIVWEWPKNQWRKWSILVIILLPRNVPTVPSYKNNNQMLSMKVLSISSWKSKISVRSHTSLIKSVKIVFLSLSSPTKSIIIVPIINLSLKVCATSAYLQLWYSNDRLTDMLIMCHLWILEKWLHLLGIGSSSWDAWSREWGICMGTIQKTQTTQTEWEWTWKQYMSPLNWGKWEESKLCKILLSKRQTLLLKL